MLIVHNANGGQIKIVKGVETSQKDHVEINVGVHLLQMDQMQLAVQLV